MFFKCSLNKYLRVKRMALFYYKLFAMSNPRTLIFNLHDCLHTHTTHLQQNPTNMNYTHTGDLNEFVQTKDWPFHTHVISNTYGLAPKPTTRATYANPFRMDVVRATTSRARIQQVALYTNRWFENICNTCKLWLVRARAARFVVVVVDSPKMIDEQDVEEAHRVASRVINTRDILYTHCTMRLFTPSTYAVSH